MLLWIGFAVLTAVVVGALARPLARRRDETLDSRAADLAVYRDQLAEIEAERASGLIAAAEAEAARAEVARRMLARADRAPEEAPSAAQAAEPSQPVGKSGRMPLRLAPIAAVPVVAALIYLVYGSPWLPDQPFARRVAAAPGAAQITELIAKVEARLKDHPDDAEGWEVLAPVYRRFERFPEAAEAYRRAIALRGPSTNRLWGLAEALIAGNDGLVSPEARATLEKVVAAEPGKLDARFWLAAAKEQDGQRAAAVADYTAVLAELPPGTGLGKAVQARLEALGAPITAGKPSLAPRLDAGPAGAAVVPDKGPTATDVAAAERMTEAQRGAMIDKMVAGLAEKLKANGRDLEGWQKLIRAYKVMGREPEALKALSEARGNFNGDAAALGALDRLAASLSLGG